jgi:hypothetical protein
VKIGVSASRLEGRPVTVEATEGEKLPAGFCVFESAAARAAWTEAATLEHWFVAAETQVEPEPEPPEPDTTAIDKALELQRILRNIGLPSLAEFSASLGRHGEFRTLLAENGRFLRGLGASLGRFLVCDWLLPARPDPTTCRYGLQGPKEWSPSRKGSPIGDPEGAVGRRLVVVRGERRPLLSIGTEFSKR